MHWKRFKALPENEKFEENYYIVGLDIGNDSSAIAFYNMAEGEPEVIDLSGGYGRPTIPTAMQYIVETKEWVYGEYAILNHDMGKEITLNNLLERLGNFEYLDIDNKPVSLVNLLGQYIKELMSNVYNINPKAEIAGIAASVPSYFSSQACEEMKRAFKSAGYEKELIALVPDRVCIFSYFYRENQQDGEKCLLIDYGAREVRGGVYTKSGGMRSLSSLFEDSIGTRNVDARVQKMFESHYSANNPIQSKQGLDDDLKDKLTAFTFQHKDILFQKAIRNKPLKLYYNFAFPPFQQIVTADEVEQLIEPFRKRFDKFILRILDKSITEKVRAASIDMVICSGGGFEMLWAREAISSLFPQSKLRLNKNPKATNAMGAAIVAAQMLEAAAGQHIEVEDRHQLPVDIGLLMENGHFVPLAECNSFWWQKHPTRFFIVNTFTSGEVPLRIMARAPEGELAALTEIPLTGLPERPKGTTRLSVQLKFSSDSEFTATISDLGFGELFPKTDYEQEIALSTSGTVSGNTLKIV